MVRSARLVATGCDVWVRRTFPVSRVSEFGRRNGRLRAQIVDQPVLAAHAPGVRQRNLDPRSSVRIRDHHAAAGTRLGAGAVAVGGPAVGPAVRPGARAAVRSIGDRKSTRLNSSHVAISYAVFCLKKKKKT